VPWVGGSQSLTGGTPRLAWKPPADHIDLASPRPAIERAHVIEDRERRQDAIALPGLKHLAAVWIELNSADAAVAQ